MRRRYRAIAAEAALLLPAAPWTADYFSGALTVPDGHMEVLPVMTAGDIVLPPAMRHAPQLISVFSLDAWQRKGLDILAKAMTLVARDIPDVTLDLYGAGSASSLAAAEQILHKAHAAHLIRLKGPLPHNNVQQTMNRYAAFVMAPRRETYGMVHVEALLGGLADPVVEGPRHRRLIAGSAAGLPRRSVVGCRMSPPASGISLRRKPRSSR